MIAKVGVLLWKDLLTELRTKEMIFSMLVFSMMVAVIFNFSFPPGSEFVKDASPGILWMTFIFAGLLGMNRSFVYEVDKGCLQGLLLTPVDRSAIYISKLLVNFIFIGTVELIATPLFAVFFDFSIVDSLGPFILVLFLSTLGLSVIGTLFSAIAVNTKTREVMLPILHFPVSIPIIICAVQATSAVFQGQQWGQIWNWLKILIAIDVIFLILAIFMFEYVVEE